MADKAVVLTVPSAGQFLIPGFLRIDPLRQINDHGKVELYIRYDDQKLNEVTLVTVKNSRIPPPNGGEPYVDLGKVYFLDGTWLYLYYVVAPAKSMTGERTTAVVGQIDRTDFYLPGFIAIDKVRQIDDEGKVELYARYDAAKVTEIHQVSVTATGPDRAATTGGTNLGVAYTPSGWTYLRCTDTVVPPPAA
ncbi:hypothetical protein [Nocardia sp. NPDC051570]|uniref:hypothetical protein n=1 Tax=Nocardia sp. NPDC051570 TaxID=3364324 RepID=UPI0037B9519F